nr:uncharacterized protein LOC106027792 [Cavia porcellus]
MTHDSFGKWSRIHKSGVYGGGQAGSPRESSLPTLSLRSRREWRSGVGKSSLRPGWRILSTPGRRAAGRVAGGRQAAGAEGLRREALQQAELGPRPRARVCKAGVRPRGVCARESEWARPRRRQPRSDLCPESRPPSPGPPDPPRRFLGQGREKVRVGVSGIHCQKGRKLESSRGEQQLGGHIWECKADLPLLPPPPPPPPLSPGITSETTSPPAPASARGIYFMGMCSRQERIQKDIDVVIQKSRAEKDCLFADFRYSDSTFTFTYVGGPRRQQPYKEASGS